MNHVFDAPEYAGKRAGMMRLLDSVLVEYGDTDPSEQEKVLYHGDRRYTGRK